MTMEVLPQDLADFLVTRNFDPEYFDDQGQPAEAGDARTMKFDYVAGTGRNYGTAVIVIADDELSLFYGDNLGRGMESEDKEEWFGFLEELSNKAASHSAMWSPKDINQLKHTLAGIAAIKEGLFEGYYGNRKVSYMGEQTSARLVINHNRVLGEADKRYRYVESLFIETADQERFKLPFKSLSGGRAMLEHVRQGGRPYDVRGTHITEIVQEMAVLSRFNRARQHRVYEGVTAELVESAEQYYRNLQGTLKHLGHSRGYHAYFESWTPDSVGEAEALVENLRDLFVEQSLDARIEAALPTLAKIQQKDTEMKEAQIFESWINQLAEGTWALPDTPEAQEKLNQLMSAELIVGPDATNATEQLYDVVGDDELFDILSDLADRSQGRANCWDDSDVQRRLAELGIQTPQSTQAEPADVPQDTAPDVKEGMGILGEKDVAEGSRNKLPQETIDLIRKYIAKFEPNANENEFIQAILRGDIHTSELEYALQDELNEAAKWRDPKYKDKLYTQRPRQDDEDYGDDDYYYPRPKNDPGRKHRMGGVGSEFDRTDPLVKGQGIGRTGIKHNLNTAGARKGLPSRDQVRSLKGSIKDVHGKHVRPNLPEGDNQATFVEENAALARMLKHAGVPVSEGVLTDSTGSTLEHIKDTFRREVKDFMQTGELNYRLERALYDYYYDDMPYGAKTGEDLDASEWISDRFAQDLGIDENLIAPQIMPVSEGSCNMTAEGEYCPEHGLAECGQASGGAVGMPYSMGEGTDDPINSNSAMTGSYYESKDGDALLARIKSLALIK